MTNFEHDWDELDPEVEEHSNVIFAAEQRAKSDPELDYFTEYSPRLPKAEIGQYVADQGFKVPLIADQADWEKAFDKGVAMIRSEMPQDYDGLSGLLSSAVIDFSWLDRDNRRDKQDFGYEMGRLIMRGLREGTLHPTEYMSNYQETVGGWPFELLHHYGTAQRFGVRLEIEPAFIGASRWRYIPGANVTVFADPNVDGRYYFGVTPASQAIGEYQVEPGEYDAPKHFRKHTKPFVARPFIEAYEAVRDLPRFDSTQCPVLELQQDKEGNIHFLQYLKTGQKQEFVDEFDLPSSPDAITLTNVRGITSPEGVELRLFLAPRKLAKGMEGQGIFCSLLQPRGLEVQLASRVAAFMLQEAYVSLKDNHFDASPLYRPPLAAGFEECTEESRPALIRAYQLVQDVVRGRHRLDYESNSYVDIKVTSNGREAVIESDWNPQTVAYDDISKAKV